MKSPAGACLSADRVFWYDRNMDNLLKQWKNEERALFKGWDFSYLKNRTTSDKLPWNYEKIAKKLVQKSRAVLDMGTGGGELFSSFGPFPGRAVAIENYPPNVKEARKKLKPLGVKVIKANEAKKLPFKNEEFDLVLNRHSAFHAKEVFRILRKNGIFFTQQVDGTDLTDLADEFKAKKQWPFWTLEYAKDKLIKAGFKIEKATKWSGKKEFKDVGAIVYFLKAVPWTVKGFNVDKYLSNLQKLQKKLDSGQKLIFTIKRFLIKAKK